MSPRDQEINAKRTTGNLRKQPAIPEDSNKRNMLAFAAREDDTGARWIPAEKHTTIAGSVLSRSPACFLSQGELLRLLLFARVVTAFCFIWARTQYSISVRSIDPWAVNRNSRTP